MSANIATLVSLVIARTDAANAANVSTETFCRNLIASMIETGCPDPVLALSEVGANIRQELRKAAGADADTYSERQVKAYRRGEIGLTGTDAKGKAFALTSAHFDLFDRLNSTNVLLSTCKKVALAYFDGAVPVLAWMDGTYTGSFTNLVKDLGKVEAPAADAPAGEGEGEAEAVDADPATVLAGLFSTAVEYAAKHNLTADLARMMADAMQTAAAK